MYMESLPTLGLLTGELAVSSKGSSSVPFLALSFSVKLSFFWPVERSARLGGDLWLELAGSWYRDAASETNEVLVLKLEQELLRCSKPDEN